MHDTETNSEIDDLAGAASDVEVEEQLAGFFEIARSAFSRNTERALRSDLRVFLTWCQHHGVAAIPARASNVVAFVDDMGRSRAPATVRRYVSSIATLHRALRLANPGAPRR